MKLKLKQPCEDRVMMITLQNVLNTLLIVCNVKHQELMVAACCELGEVCSSGLMWENLVKAVSEMKFSAAMDAAVCDSVHD